MNNIKIEGLKDEEYYLNVTRMLIAKYHPQNRDLVEEYNRLNSNLLNNLISHFKKCEYYNDVKRMILVKEIGDKNETPHIHSILVFEDYDKMVYFMKYIQTRILKAYKDDVSIIPKKDVKYYIYYIFKTFKPSWVIYKDYYCGNNFEVLNKWRLMFKKLNVTQNIINHVTVFKDKVKLEDYAKQSKQIEQILTLIIKEELNNKKPDNYMFVDE